MDHIYKVTLFLSVIIASLTQDATNNVCEVPGTCMSLHTCDLIDKYIKARDPNLLKKFQICGFDQTIPRICCVPPKQEHDVVKDAINFDNTTKIASMRPSTDVTNTLEVAELQPQRPELSTSKTHTIPTSETTPRPQMDFAERTPNHPIYPVNQRPIINGRVTPPTPTAEYLQEQHVPPYPFPNVTYDNHYNITIANKVTLPDHDLLPNRKVCGHQKSTALFDRVIGGEMTDIDEFPWMVRLRMERLNDSSFLGYSCGGSLISDRYVVTAAHCTHNNARLKITEVRLGEWNGETEKDCDIQNHCNDPPVDIPVEKIIASPDFSNGPKIKGDIALIRMQRPVQFTDYIRPICLPTTDYVAKLDINSISDYYAAGWGKTEYGSFSAVKRKVLVNTVDTETCKLSYAGKVTDDTVPTIICAGGRKGYDTCSGDSGGPLMQHVDQNGNKNWFLYGVISLGKYPCGREGQPAVYTRITYYMDWIMENLKG